MLVAGGLDPVSQNMSAKVTLYKVTVKSMVGGHIARAKVMFEGADAMESSDYFPHNQWISDDETCTDK